MSAFHILEPHPQDGATNMAADEVLLTAAIETQQLSLRWYRWGQPTISLGYFQPADDPSLTDELAKLPRVRRLSGGGAILHHHEWTYSIAVPAEHPLAQQPGEIYTAMHRALVETLNSLGCTLSLRGEQLDERESQYLCYGRGDAKDVVCGPHKIIGSAQRRRRGAILQHGSVMLATSPFTPQFPGLRELTAVSLPDEDTLGERFATVAAQVLWPNPHDRPAVAQSWPPPVQSDINQLAAGRYSELAWNRRTNNSA